jgi:hypothetical protein
MNREKVMFRSFCVFVMVSMASALLLAPVVGAQDYPIMDRVADKVIQKYQNSTCEQLWQEKGQSKPPMEQELVQMLQGDPQMRAAFLNKVAAPIANKMFECGMIP